MKLPVLFPFPAGLLPAAFALLGSATLRADENTAQRLAVEEVMRRSNDHYLATFPIGNAAWNRGAYHTGNFRAWETLGVQAYLDHSIAWATANSWLTGPDAADADTQACGQTYLDLYKIDPQPVRIAAIKSRLDLLVSNPASEDDWWWIDAFFMAGPTFTRLGVIESNPAYFVQLEKMYSHMKNTRDLFDPAHGLWYRDAEAKNRSGPNTPEFWSRGNGWVIAACVRVLEQLPAGDPRRAEFAGMLQTMAAALLPLQGSDGFWRSNLEFPNHVPNPETSGTAFFVYALAYGINEGLLDAPAYTPAVMNAWNGLTTLALQPDGLLGYVQAIGKAPNPADPGSQQDYGYGALLLAGSEILRLSGGPAPIFPDAGPDATFADADSDQVETVTLNAARTSIRSGGITRYSWWLGSTFLGEGPQLTLEFPRGSHEVTLQVETTGGDILTNTTSVTVTPPEILVTASGNETGNPPANTLDQSFATRWSQWGEGEWIRFELPAASPLDHVDIAFYQGNQRVSYFAIELSLDGTTWDTVGIHQSSGATLGFETFPFPTQTAKFVRYLGDGNQFSQWNSVTEVSIQPVEPPPDDDGNGLADAWEIHYFQSAEQDPALDPNGDGTTLAEDFILGGDPFAQNPNLLRIATDENGQRTLILHARAAFGPGYIGKTRRFRVLTSETLDPGAWEVLPGGESVLGDNLSRSLAIPESGGPKFYRLASWLE